MNLGHMDGADAAAAQQQFGDAMASLGGGVQGLPEGLLNMPLQEQLRLLQGLDPNALPLFADADAAAAAATPPSGGGGRRRKGGAAAARRAAVVVRCSDREPTKGTANSTNKPLSSKFRGVCWNRKNKRWQAAINSGGALPGFVSVGSLCLWLSPML